MTNIKPECFQFVYDSYITNYMLIEKFYEVNTNFNFQDTKVKQLKAGDSRSMKLKGKEDSNKNAVSIDFNFIIVQIGTTIFI